jgi:site-specific recombinase XerD
MRYVDPSRQTLTPRADGRTLDPYIRRYLDERRRRGELVPETCRVIEKALRTFSENYGRRPIDKLSPRDIERWLETMVAAGLKPSTRGMRLSSLRVFLDWCRTKKYLRSDPMLGIKAPRRPRMAVQTINTVDVDSILAACPDARARAIVTLMYVLGTRCVEVARLNVEDYDRVTRTLRLVGKGLHEREVPVPPRAAVALDAYLAEFPASSGPFFRSYSNAGERVQSHYVSKLVSRWCRAAGVKHRPFDGVSAHAFRRTAATELLMATNDLTATQELLGHASPATLAPYLKRAHVERIREALAVRLDGDPSHADG